MSSRTAYIVITKFCEALFALILFSAVSIFNDAIAQSDFEDGSTTEVQCMEDIDCADGMSCECVSPPCNNQICPNVCFMKCVDKDSDSWNIKDPDIEYHEINSIDGCKEIRMHCGMDVNCWQREINYSPGINCEYVPPEDWEKAHQLPQVPIPSNEIQTRMEPVGNQNFDIKFVSCNQDMTGEIKKMCIERCSVTTAEGCVESCVQRKTEEGCSVMGAKNGSVKMGTNSDNGSSGGGCRPFEYNMFGGSEITPQKQIKMYKERTMAWIEDMAGEQGIGLSIEEMEKLPLCPGLRENRELKQDHEIKQTEFHRFEENDLREYSPIPIMGTTNEPDGRQGAGNVGDVIGMMIGRFVSMSQDPSLSENEKQKVSDTIIWFSVLLNRVVAGENIGELVKEAKERVQNIMQIAGQIGVKHSVIMQSGEIRNELDRIMKVAEEMITKKIPKALLIAQEMGKDVSELRSTLDGLDNKFGEIRRGCFSAMENNSIEDLKECIKDMKLLLDVKMRDLEKQVEKILTMEEIREIERRIESSETGMGTKVYEIDE